MAVLISVVISVVVGISVVIDVSFVVTNSVSFEFAVEVAVAGDVIGELIALEVGSKELAFVDAFIEFVNKEGGGVLLLKVFNLLLFEGINGI